MLKPAPSDRSGRATWSLGRVCVVASESEAKVRTLVASTVKVPPLEGDAPGAGDELLEGHGLNVHLALPGLAWLDKPD